MDRLTSLFLDANAANQLTARFPLQPFVNGATRLAYDEPRRWMYTTIGDMAKDTRALGYMYAPPASPDVLLEPDLAAAASPAAPQPAGGRAISVLPLTANGTDGPSARNATATAGADSRVPYVVFTGVGCTASSYRIDVFAPRAASLVADPRANPDYIGQVTRLGMGPGRPGGGGRGPGNWRCRKPEATRVLSAGRVADRVVGGAMARRQRSR